MAESETGLQVEKKSKQIRKPKRLFDIFNKALLSRNLNISINFIGSNLKEVLERKIASEVEGRCIPEGYVKIDSVKLLTYSSGKITNGNMVSFEVVFECQICLPVEGMLIECKSKVITKAGIKAEIDGDLDSPVIIFIARDHHYLTPYFSTVKEDQMIKVRVIGQRFELNDKAISIIAELIEPVEFKKEEKKKPRLVLTDEDPITIKPKKKKKKLVPVEDL